MAAANHNKKQWEAYALAAVLYKTELMVMNRKDAMVTGCRSVDVLYFFFFLLSNSIVLFIVPCWGGRSHNPLASGGVPFDSFLRTTYDDASPPTSARLLQHWPRVCCWAPPFLIENEGRRRRFWLGGYRECWFLLSFFSLYSPVIVEISITSPHLSFAQSLKRIGGKCCVKIWREKKGIQTSLSLSLSLSLLLWRQDSIM